MWCGLNQTGTPWATSRFRSRRALAWSWLAWERNSLSIRVAHAGIGAQGLNFLHNLTEFLGRFHLAMGQLEKDPRHVLTGREYWADEHRENPAFEFSRKEREFDILLEFVGISGPGREEEHHQFRFLQGLADFLRPVVA